MFMFCSHFSLKHTIQSFNMIATGSSVRHAKRSFAAAAKPPKGHTLERTLVQEEDAEIQNRLKRMRAFAPVGTTNVAKGLEQEKKKPEKAMKFSGPVYDNPTAQYTLSGGTSSSSRSTPPPNRQGLALWQEVTDEQLAAFWRYEMERLRGRK